MLSDVRRLPKRCKRAGVTVDVPVREARKWNRLDPDFQSADQHRIEFLFQEILCRALSLRFLAFTDELTDFAGMLPIESFGERFLNSFLGGKRDEHIEPCDGLKQRPLRPDGKNQQECYGRLTE